MKNIIPGVLDTPLYTVAAALEKAAERAKPSARDAADEIINCLLGNKD